MSEQKPENDCGLIIDPAVLADIRAACQRRAVELEAARSTAPQDTSLPVARPPTNSSLPGSEEQAQGFAAAVEAMPVCIRAFFEREEAVPAWQRESEEERTERERLTALGGWCGG
jgi:hypothetical protein